MIGQNLLKHGIEKAETETDRAVKNTYLDKAIAIYDQW